MKITILSMKIMSLLMKITILLMKIMSLSMKITILVTTAYIFTCVGVARRRHRSCCNLKKCVTEQPVINIAHSSAILQILLQQ